MFERFANASAFLFDCDGCLLDSMGTWRVIETDLINRTGREWTQSDLEEVRAAPIHEVARIFHERYGLFDSPQGFFDLVDETMLDFYQNKVKPCAGAREFVYALKEHGVPCCVVSSSPEHYIRTGLTTCDMLDAFSGIFSTKETNLSKQDKKIWNMALESVGAQAQTAWGADDSLYAIHVMNACGLSTIGSYDADDAGTFEDLSKHATIAIRSFEELLD